MREIHHRVEFEPLKDGIPDHLAIASYGEAESGKTTFITTMPDPIGVIALDRKTRPRLQAANRTARKQLLFPKDDFIRHAEPLKISNMDPDAAMKFYASHLSRIQDAVFSLAERKDIRSIAIDPGTQLWEDILFKHFGRAFRIMPRDRSAPNADMRELINACQSKHLLITHQASEVWRNDKPTGRNTWAGWSKLDYYTNVIIEHEFNEKSKTFTATVRLCQDNPALINDTVLTGEDINFDMLAAMIYPDGQW